MLPTSNSSTQPIKKPKPSSEKELKAKKTQEERDKSFITSQAIISRIKWDEKFSEFLDDFTIGYLDRFNGLMSTTIKEFEDADEIPYHRIWYVYFNGIIVWDREKRIDNVSKGKLEVTIEDYFKQLKLEEERKRKEALLEEKKKKKKRHTSESTEDASTELTNDEQPVSSSSEEDSEEDEDIGAELKQEEPTEEGEQMSALGFMYNKRKRAKKVVLSRTKTRKAQKEYVPEDDLELWLLEHNEENEALVLQFPTHISQCGGHYHIIFDTRKKYDDYIAAWKSAIEKKQKTYVEEMRTKHAFRLYIDIDIKLTVANSPFDIVKEGWVKMIQDFANTYFNNEKDTTVVVTQCHGNWHDKNTKTAKYKSGYRIYFHEIIVDYEGFCDFTYQLSYHMAEKIGSYPNQPLDWSFDDVIDLKSCNHPRCRLFGTTKFRRGKILPRIYQFCGVFGRDTQFDEQKTLELTKDLTKLLPLTSSRVEDPFDEEEQ